MTGLSAAQRLLIVFAFFSFISCSGLVDYIHERQIATNNPSTNSPDTRSNTNNKTKNNSKKTVATKEESISTINRYEAKWGVDLPDDADTNLIKEIDSWLGVPYKYGGKDKSGTDCSGMVFSIYNNVYGFSLNRSSYDIIQNVIKVPIEEAKFGDLVFFKIYKNRVSHVGIYLGDKKFIHASTQLGVRIDSLEMPYYRDRFYMAGRIKDELLKKDTVDKSKDQ
ncbi:MAG TPA: C40 family peptidase [Bacteroidales bacterium]|nr:C40 family peptidase [Bacteroidales bacterium]HOU83183.1 C40 family peptidase [Bacteroidales bacterium]HQE77682.1 C40 family peptidase [Bacteroidales bacterium]HRS69430.1 C40 family peptidase [Bacteroidales bacterium]